MNLFKKKWPLVLYLLLTFSCIFGCANHPSLNEPVSKEIYADSLRAKFALTIFNSDGSKQDLDAVLFSVPEKRYRLELTGPLGIGVASLLWTDSIWVMTFPTEKLFMKGSGYMVGLLTDKNLPLVQIHQMASLFKGELLPKNFEELEVKKGNGIDTIFAKENSGRKFSYVKSADVLSLERPNQNGNEILRFYDFKIFDNIRMPSRIVFEKGTKKFLEIRVKKVNKNKSFSSGIWRLNVPKSFSQIQ